MKLINIWTIFIISPLILSCSPVPIESKCNQIVFKPMPELRVTGYFNTSGVFMGYCPTKTANQYRLSISSELAFNIRVEHEWIRVQPANRDQEPITITASNTIDKTDETGLTHVRVLTGAGEPLVDDFVDLKFEGKGKLRLMMEYADCVCVGYDGL